MADSADRRHPRPPSGPVLGHRDFARTLVYDGLVLALAAVMRGLCLAVFAWVAGWAPDYKTTWALRALEWTLDVGLVAGAVLLVAVDFTKRVIIAGKAIRDAWRS